MSANTDNGTTGRRTTNLLLAAIAGLLLFQVADRMSVFEPAAAHAAQDRPGGLISAAAQRQDIIKELKGLSTRMVAIEKQLQGELRVRVTDMPEIKIPRDEKRED
ncbi:MAG: hypothetical protein EA378_08570 [Phycisphaerales bacterium]|nr:MAG: hypothetical protein EA378_08570 [Phycisphaerales bacterium]